ncbi:hypothetical protein CCHOA_01275 [Corynebacterium choanae]|uniref:Uncharacterized protein n=1 Tax=Corynebacterium choanae TaxID=1862358 RepID=A0A3G6J4M7_9CORY|nr:hypothetical protein CCHOA_01275 [Corynebacterium choanae]
MKKRVTCDENFKKDLKAVSSEFFSEGFDYSNLYFKTKCLQNSLKASLVPNIYYDAVRVSHTLTQHYNSYELPSVSDVQPWQRDPDHWYLSI